jgi:hypothetical protein
MSQFTDQFAVGGVPINEFMASGTVYFVRPSTGSDGNSGKTPSKALKTLAQALVLATHFGDTVYLIAESNSASGTTDYQSAALDWSTDGVHLVGLTSKPFIGHRARIAQLSTVKTIEDLFTLSANNCYIRGIEIYQGVASATADLERAMVVSGQRNRIENCQISGIGDTSMDDAGSCSLVITGSENYFKDDYIGLDTVIRATATYEVYLLGTSGAPIARTIFDGCMVNSYTSLSTFKALDLTYVDRFFLLKDTVLGAVQGITSSVAPTGAIATTTLNGQVWMLGGGVFGYADVTTADNSAVLVLTHSGLAANVVDQGVAKGTDVA